MMLSTSYHGVTIQLKTLFVYVFSSEAVVYLTAVSLATNYIVCVIADKKRRQVFSGKIQLNSQLKDEV